MLPESGCGFLAGLGRVLGQGIPFKQVDGQDRDGQLLILHPTRHLVQLGQPLQAGSAPRRPEIKHDDLVTQISEIDDPAIEGFENESRRFLADQIADGVTAALGILWLGPK